MAYRDKLPIPQPTPGVNVFGAQLNINNKRDVTAVGADLLSDKYMRGLEGERTRLMSKNMPVTAPRPGESATPGLFNDMGYHASLPGATGQPERMAPTSIANTESLTNNHTPYTRMCLAPANGSETDLPSRHELVFMKKTRESNPVTIIKTTTSKEQKNMVNLDVVIPPQNSSAAIRVNTQPFLVLNIVAWQKYIYQSRKQLMKTNPERARTLTVREIMQGVPDVHWTGWTVDSVVTLEMDAGNHSTADGGRFHTTLNGNPTNRFSGNDNTRIYTVTVAGKTEIVDYWCSRGVQEGGNAFIGIKLYDPVRLENRNNIPFVTSNKGRVHDMMGGNIVTSESIAYMKKSELRGVMKPVLDGKGEGEGEDEGEDSAKEEASQAVYAVGMYPIFSPAGGLLDPGIMEYTNEWGDQQIGVILPIGRVLFLPVHFKQQMPAAQNKNSEVLRPFIDNSETMLRERLTILLHNNKDGHIGMY